MRTAVAAAALLLLWAVPAGTAATPAAPKYDGSGLLVQVPFAPLAPKHRLTENRALSLFLATPKVEDWVGRYPKKSLVKQATYDEKYADWDVKVWSGPAGQIAAGRVDDLTGAVTEAWTGPQVAWKMARGGGGAFGGKKINSLTVWLSFCAVFLLGLADLRRPLSLRNLDLLALLSFSVSLWYFNHGRIFTSVPLVYPGLAYLLGRTVWIGVRGRPPRASRPVWPIWVLAAATVFVGGFKVGLNVRDSNVIDVGFAGVIGAERIVHGRSPYGNFPVEDARKACGPADREGEIRERIQANGRCEAANPNGDTYGPAAYLAYVPGYAFFGWTGKWDDLPASHFTAIVFDLLCLVGLGLAGRRFGGNRLGVTLAFAWAAYPFDQYVSNSNTNDSIMPAFLIWGFWLVTSPWARGAFAALTGALLIGFEIVLTHWFYLYLPWFFAFVAYAVLAEPVPATVTAEEADERQTGELVIAG